MENTVCVQVIEGFQPNLKVTIFRPDSVEGTYKKSWHRCQAQAHALTASKLKKLGTDRCT